MSSVQTDLLSKSFGDAAIVRDLSFNLAAGKFLTVLGPSGCGKTTTLRMLAGLEMPTSGRIVLGEEDVTWLPTYKRKIGMVFQNLALFPHMTVAQNVAFGLRMRGGDSLQSQKATSDALAMVRLEQMAHRYPSQLSGGQQQRVALARALVYRPSLLLLDEPFAALDRKLREAMQIELRDLTREIGITTVFVTHDQEEALVMSDLIAVMNSGKLEQCSAPVDLYERPATRFVADFMGVGNLIPAKIISSDASGATILFLGRALNVSRAGLDSDSSVTVTIRPRRLRLSSSEQNDAVRAQVRSVTYHGGSVNYVLKVGEQDLFATEDDTAGSSCAARFKIDDVAWVSWQADALHIITE